jgi:hypothetical protein
MGTKVRKAATAPAEEPGASAGVELPERWSVQRKMELVLRLLRGEALDAASRESQIPAHELESWKRVFLDTGTRGLTAAVKRAFGRQRGTWATSPTMPFVRPFFAPSTASCCIDPVSPLSPQPECPSSTSSSAGTICLPRVVRASPARVVVALERILSGQVVALPIG